MTPLLLATPGDEACATALCAHAGAEFGTVVVREFPDGELFVRIDSACADREVWIVSTLHPVAPKLLGAYFLAATARDLGATRVGLCAPYLAYLRQDARFGGGEGLTSRYVARMLSGVIDRLVTVDPHLHRYHALDQVYEVPSRVVSAAPHIAGWLRGRYPCPVVVGPDAESRQWATVVAQELDCPLVVLDKTRRGDREVSVSALPASCDWRAVTPIVIDDIVSTARTMIETVGALASAGAAAPVCVAVHAVFAGDAMADLRAAGVREIVTCNTIPHASNAIDVLDLVGAALSRPW